MFFKNRPVAYLLKMIFVFGLLAFPLCAGAVRAYPFPISVRLPDGSALTIRIYGDEYFRYTTTDDGYTIAQKNDGYYYYADINGSGNVTTGNIRAHDSGSRGMAESAMLSVKTKGIAVSAVTTRSGEMRRAMQMQKAVPATGKRKFLVILAEFSDLGFKTPNAGRSFTDLLTQEGYSANGGTGSAYDYYKDNSNGRFTPEYVVVGPVKLPQNMAYYGANDGSGNDLRPRQMVIDACQAAKTAGTVFSQFDTDGDNVLDNVFVYYAGYNEAEGGGANTVWPHQWTVEDFNVRINGVLLSRYACSSELRAAAGAAMVGIGTFCHEFGHVLGLPDLYDTDGSIGGEAPGLYDLALMCSGNYNNEGRTPPYMNVLERTIVGWMEPEELTVSGQYNLPSIDNNKAYSIQTGNNGEYYLLENRQLQGWDAYLVSSGILIYRIDRSGNIVDGATAMSRWEANTLNNVKAHQCADLVEADGIETAALATAGMFFPGTRNVKEFSNRTTPAAVGWSGKSFGKNIFGIKQTGGQIYFEMRTGDANNPLGLTVQTARDEAFVSWNALLAGSHWTLMWRKKGETAYQQVETDSSYVFLTGLLPDTQYELKLESAGEESAWSFTTIAGNPDFAAIGGVSGTYTVGQRFGLLVMNKPSDAVRTVWKLNDAVVVGRVVKLGAGKNELRLELTTNAGDTEVVVKIITAD